MRHVAALLLVQRQPSVLWARPTCGVHRHIQTNFRGKGEQNESRVLEIEPFAIGSLRKGPDRVTQRQLRESHLVGVALADAKP